MKMASLSVGQMLWMGLCWYWLLGDKPVCPSSNDPRELLIYQLRIRTARFRRSNQFLFILILLVLSGAAYVALNAGKIVGEDAQASALEKSIDHVENLLEEIDQNVASIAVIAGLLENSGHAVTFKNINSLLENVPCKGKVITAKVPEGTKPEALKKLITSCLEHFKDIQLKTTDHLSKQYETREEIQKKQAANSVNGPPLNLMVATGVIRFGVLTLSLYLVQILIGLYRYNAQVAAHYAAQGDALQLLGHDAKGVADMLAPLRPSTLFGKPSASLPEKVLESFREALKDATDSIKKSS